MTEPSKAVFLSYASKDAEAAQRISEALTTAGVEVWFDKSELRGGDAWDQSIRQQIKSCALLIPIISANTQERHEGYFRLEWNLAVERSRLIVAEKAFLLPVVVDDTSDGDALVPDRFREVQWTRLRGGHVPNAFVERVQTLLRQSVHARPSPAALPSKRRRSSLAIAALVAAAAVLVGGLLYWQRQTAGVAQTAATTAPIPDKSIAVLPFVDMSEKRDQEYFSDGLAEELLSLLAQVQDLRVPGRTSSFSFRGKSDDIPTIAQKLRVAHVLEGSVRKAGDTIRVTVELIRAETGYHVWSKTYDRDFKDVFKVQDEIAAAVVEALKAKLAPAQPVASYRSRDPEAYNQYLLGRQFHSRGTVDGQRRAIEAYRKAISLDASYAAAYAALATAEASLADLTDDAAMLKQANTDADRAIAADPKEADGYAVRAYLRASWGWDWNGAQADFAKALALDPNSRGVQRSYGILLADLGRLPEAIAAEKKATDLDPLASADWNSLGRYQMESRDFRAAGESLRRALEIAPESPYALNNLAALQLLQGNADQALATARKIEIDIHRQTNIAMAEHSRGDAHESQRALDELIAKHAHDSAYQIAEAYVWRGEKDNAYHWLERAYAQRDGGLSDIKVDPLIDGVRGDARFKALLRKMNFPD